MLVHLSPWGLVTDVLLQAAFLVVTLGIVLWISTTVSQLSMRRVSSQQSMP